MDIEKTQKSWAFVTASIRLCVEAHRMLERDGISGEIKSLEAAISELLKTKALVGRRIRG